ncbi:hippurate hydrolase [Fusarium subglutinans]|uniref:Hippurate hydrolase n=1 Tax=Gibberella subglutinans TaxID=42677 RepID=A0A8H5V5S5_GIBSU|nr:hippurate hydrolase [Fusarium subglutinans]KAF5611641.1 hippurate hydrolase [Fusarium subglutinans]
MSQSILSDLVHQHRPDLQPLEELYKHLHRNPELSNQEVETAATIAKRLEETGPEDLVIKPHIGGHGLAAVLRNGDGPTVLLRADIDALPVEETTGLQYASTKRMIHAASGVEKPVMHACGHDMHIVTLLGAAATLFSSRESWAGTLVLAFQPAEERGTGAQAMVDDGLYTKHDVPVPDFVLGAHVRPLRAGTIGTRRGLVATSADNYKVTIHGKGSHASMPHTAIDPIAISANAILKLQTLVSREVDPAESSVITVTSIHAGDAENVIADSAVLGVDTRSTTVATREHLLKRIKTVIEAECSCANVLKSPEFEQTRAFPLTINDESVTIRVEETFAVHFGEGSGKYDRNMPKLAFSEDFSILATAVDKPYCFFTYGCVDGEVWDKAEKEGTVAQSIAANHSSKFAPVIHPTLKTGLDGYALGALTFLVKGHRDTRRVKKIHTTHHQTLSISLFLKMPSRARSYRRALAPCSRCLDRKTTCNQGLPYCSRCAKNPACCKYEICGSSETRTSTHIIRVMGSTTSFERLKDDDSEPPMSTRPLFQLGPCGWDLTEHGQAELMQAIFAERYLTYPEPVSEDRLMNTVDIILRERGCTLETLLEDEVFESFPLVRSDYLGSYAYEDRGLSRPGLILAILLVTTLPCNHTACLKTKRLYLTVLAMLPILQSQLSRSNGVIRIQALVAVYEYGHGLYDQSHLNLNSAICMASRIELDSIGLDSLGLKLALELRLSLMLLDCMLALSTHDRDEGWLPLICHPGHTMARAVEDYLPLLRTPEGTPRPGDTVQSALSMHQTVSISGFVLQHIHDSKRSPRVSRHECDTIYAQTLRMVEVALKDKTTDMHHSVLLSSSRKSTWRLLKDVLCSYSDDEHDDLHMESLISLMPSMNSLCIIVNDPEDDSTIEEIAEVMPYIKYAAKRWTAIRPFANRIARSAGLDAHFRIKYDAFGEHRDEQLNHGIAIPRRRKGLTIMHALHQSQAKMRPSAAMLLAMRVHPADPLASAVEKDNSQPSSTDCYLSLGTCGWDLTKHGQSQLMEAMLAYDTDDSIATARLVDGVGAVFRDRGCTLLELLEDPVFEAFFLVEHLHTTGCLHRSQFDKFSWPILHLAVLLVASPPCDHKACSQTKRLYVTVKALSALMQLRLPNHAELVQTQGLIALYECGHGMLELAHVTLNSAFTMAARLDVDLSNILASLEWRLSLMLLDILVALQTLHRKHNWIPLACPPGHDMHVQDSKRDPRTANPHCELMDEIESFIPPFDEYPKHLDLDQSFELSTRNEEEKQEMASCGRICQSDLPRTSAKAAV